MRIALGRARLPRREWLRNRRENGGGRAPGGLGGWLRGKVARRAWRGVFDALARARGVDMRGPRGAARPSAAQEYLISP